MKTISAQCHQSQLLFQLDHMDSIHFVRDALKCKQGVVIYAKYNFCLLN